MVKGYRLYGCQEYIAEYLASKEPYIAGMLHFTVPFQGHSSSTAAFQREVVRRLAAITVSIDIADKVETSQQVARQLDVQNISTRRAACTQALLIFLGIILQPYELRLSALWMPGVYS